MISLLCVCVCGRGEGERKLSLIDRNNATANRDRLESRDSPPLIRSRSNDAAWIYIYIYIYCGHRSFLLIEWPNATRQNLYTYLRGYHRLFLVVLSFYFLIRKVVQSLERIVE